MKTLADIKALAQKTFKNTPNTHSFYSSLLSNTAAARRADLMVANGNNKLAHQTAVTSIYSAHQTRVFEI